MKLLQIRIKNIICILIIMAMSLSLNGFSYADDEVVDVNLISPHASQLYKPGDTVEISGTAQNLVEVSVVVRNAQGLLIFAAQPRVINSVFSTSFTLESDAADGKYTISIGGLGLSATRREFVVRSTSEVNVILTKPSAGTEFKAVDAVEIAGTVQNLSQVVICVRNSKNGRVFVAQPAVADGSFTTRFTLPADAMDGEYSIQITGAELAAQTFYFKVTSAGGGDPGGTEPKKDAILFIKGNGVANELSYTRAELEAMNQEREILSATSDYPEDLMVAVEGVPVRTLLQEAGISWGSAQKITFGASDGYTAEFTIDELFNQKRYIFPGQIEIEPIIALKRAERTSNFSDMTTQDTPVMCYGQRAQTEQTLLWFVKRLQTITVSTSSPGTWPRPEAKISTPDSNNKVATQGGEVKSGSQVYLHCSDVLPRLYYTTDGSMPDLNSKIFNLHGCGPLQGQVDPIPVDKTTTVKAIAVGRGKRNSDVAEFKFTVKGEKPLEGIIVEKPVDEKNINTEKLKLENGRTGERLSLQEGTLEDIEKGERGSRLVIASGENVDEVQLEVPASLLQKAQEKSMLIGLNTNIGNYTLPLSVLDFRVIADELGVKQQELHMNIIISKTTEDVNDKMSASMEPGQQMLAHPVDFCIEITAPGGKKIEYKSFGSTYIERDIPLDGNLNVNQAMGAIWNEAKGRFSPLPTRFETRNGQNVAVILNRTNSIYTVLQYSRTFADIKDHWAQADIELLAAKMLISGKSETSYDPGSNITRAEFVTLLVRALGLEEGVLKEGQFKDVSSTAWYAGSVAAAINENIIKGYEGNLFKPEENITREEIAAMIIRAAHIAGKSDDISDSEQQKQLGQFKDKTDISSWAAHDIALAAQGGIIKGMPDGDFSPQTYVDRAQSAALLKRFLIYVNFITAS